MAAGIGFVAAVGVEGFAFGERTVAGGTDVFWRNTEGFGLVAQDGPEVHLHVALFAGGKEGGFVWHTEGAGESVFDFEIWLAKAGTEADVNIFRLKRVLGEQGLQSEGE